MTTVNGTPTPGYHEDGARDPASTATRETDRLTALVETLMQERREREAQIAEERAQREEQYAREPPVGSKAQ